MGINQSTCIGMNYPLSVKRPPDMDKSRVKKVIPSAETIEKFIKWVQTTTGFIQRKVDNYPIPQMMIAQLLDEVNMLLRKGDSKSEYEGIYTKLNSLVWNSNSRGLLTQNEYIELTNHLVAFEGELFRISLK